MDNTLIDIHSAEFRWSHAGPAVLAIEELKVRRSERLFLKGPSGSGKSTLLNLLGGVTVPQRGTVKVLGQDLETLSTSARDRFRAEHVGYIFQLFNLVPYLSVFDNVRLPLRFSDARRARVGRDLRAEAGRLITQLGLGADLLDRPATELSVGQQQRVAAARALIGGPELVIADEPTSALDADTRTLFIQLLMDECATQDATLVFVSHDASLEPLFDRGLDLREINQAGTHVDA